jgi:hypothetical protein
MCFRRNRLWFLTHHCCRERVFTECLKERTICLASAKLGEAPGSRNAGKYKRPFAAGDHDGRLLCYGLPGHRDSFFRGYAGGANLGTMMAKGISSAIFHNDGERLRVSSRCTMYQFLNDSSRGCT